MDIEGAERNVLQGTVKTIKRFHPCMAPATENLDDDYMGVPWEVAEDRAGLRRELRALPVARVDYIPAGHPVFYAPAGPRLMLSANRGRTLAGLHCSRPSKTEAAILLSFVILGALQVPTRQRFDNFNGEEERYRKIERAYPGLLHLVHEVARGRVFAFRSEPGDIRQSPGR